jgi:hypothetical protein
MALVALLLVVFVVLVDVYDLANKKRLRRDQG